MMESIIRAFEYFKEVKDAILGDPVSGRKLSNGMCMSDMLKYVVAAKMLMLLSASYPSQQALDAVVSERLQELLSKYDIVASQFREEIAKLLAWVEQQAGKIHKKYQTESDPDERLRYYNACLLGIRDLYIGLHMVRDYMSGVDAIRTYHSGSYQVLWDSFIAKCETEAKEGTTTNDQNAAGA